MREKLRQYKVKDEYFDVSNWEKVDISHLSYKQKQLFNRRKNAIDNYLSTDTSVSDLCNRLGIAYKDFYKILDRCFTVKENGRIFGYEALIPGFRIKKIIKNSQTSSLRTQ